MRLPATDPTAVRATVVRWHSGDISGDSTVEKLHLLPLKHLVNHHPDGGQSVQPGMPRRTTVTTGLNSSATETFEDYGELDALQLLMHHGYVDHDAQVVHSLPIRVTHPVVGSLQVAGRGSAGRRVDGLASIWMFHRCLTNRRDYEPH